MFIWKEIALALNEKDVDEIQTEKKVVLIKIGHMLVFILEIIIKRCRQNTHFMRSKVACDMNVGLA